MQRNAYSSGRGQKNGYQDNHEPQTQQSVYSMDRWLNDGERCAPWIPEDKNSELSHATPILVFWLIRRR